VEWKQLKVGRNYHISCDSQHYSVPYTYAGQLLRVRVTSTTVTGPFAFRHGSFV